MTNQRDEQRIKLAEFTGEIVKVRHSLPYPNGLGWKSPQGEIRPVPNPRTDANDCEALIAHLMELGWYVEIGFQTYPEPRHYVEGMGVFLHIWHVDTEQHERIDYSFDNWKQGVCELAEKVIDNE